MRRANGEVDVLDDRARRQDRLGVARVVSQRIPQLDEGFGVVLKPQPYQADRRQELGVVRREIDRVLFVAV